jgi:hypothetical protein
LGTTSAGIDGQGSDPDSPIGDGHERATQFRPELDGAASSEILRILRISAVGCGTPLFDASRGFLATGMGIRVGRDWMATGVSKAAAARNAAESCRRFAAFSFSCCLFPGARAPGYGNAAALRLRFSYSLTGSGLADFGGR